MKLYTYETLEGNFTIEVDEKWHTWLIDADCAEFNQERCHTRADHKYAYGKPVSLDSLDNANDWLVFKQITSYSAVELMVDLETALGMLTDLQRRYFILNRIKGYSYCEIARVEQKNETSIRRSVKGAERKIRNYFLVCPN